ncbi:sodium:proton antiporter [Streptomyces sp. VRA16 Mangrove soil]|uniref:cation:proton antiporter n=1 Tax=Streptomyces sp. VRA16 Mangrove soil TaxID=2817434 RepID=UPI001A9FFA2D|nr:cation:proton antiporter [Streptomyces sp. VRA16 Mangrove soil]MBO1332996.1 cation:proton antiporter [Streptomyces sp. VRA16 Mangrove soil]
MEVTLIAVVGVASIVAVAAFSQRLGLAAPLSLVVVGIALSFVPGVPVVELEPEWVLAGVLPPLLYSSAVNMPAQDFRRDIKAIGGLAVLLVAVSTLGAGWFVHLLMPDIGWPAAFALGAVVSPTDAVAATSVGRKLGLPSRLLTLLEGEGLVNDASALVLLRSAVAALAGAVSLWGVAWQFVFSVVVAVAVGVVVGLVNVRVRALLDDTVLNTAISFVVPFVAYVPAEEFDASGVLAVVVTGLVTGHLSPRLLRAQDRIGEAMNWRTLAFLLESTIFLLMGLGLKTLLDEAHTHDNGLGAGRVVLYGLALTGLVIVVRMVFVVPLVAMVRRDERRAAAAKPLIERMQERLEAAFDGDDRFTPRKRAHIERRVHRVGADIDFRLTETLGWRGGVVLAWSGMRGAITVAAAQTLPEDTPYRAQLVLIAFVVAVTTLLLQGLSLPAVIRTVKIPGDDPQRLRDEYGRLITEMSEAASDALDEATAGGAVDPSIVDRVRRDSLMRTRDEQKDGEGADAADGDGPAPDPAGTDEMRASYMRLRLAVVAAEREALLDARTHGAYSSRALSGVQSVLDLEEARLQQLGDRLDT